MGRDRPFLATVIAEHRERLLQLPGVVAVGEGEDHGEPCVRVYVAAPDGPTSDLPAMLDGYPVVTRAAGRLLAEGPSQRG